ncbi:MAG: ATP-binding cassette domain-containing protein [Bacteroidota bacterium]
MDEPIIIIKNLSKIYNQRDSGILSPSDLEKYSPSSGAKAVIALNDISLDIYSGETVGIIGKNGAGKSTLLKIISNIIKPTFGQINISGTVAAAVEIGMSFHPDLTGNDCISFACSLLGFKNKAIKEIRQKIIDFSGLNTKINTKIKYYSHGMLVRLAFSIVSHIESNILLFDEMQMIGEDIIFKKQVYDKIHELNKSGKTMIFVSHHLAEIESFCSRTALLDAGKLIAIGETEAIINQYKRLTVQ